MPAGYIPTSVATGDFNGDGKKDFVVANGGDNTLWLYFGKGDGTFNLPIILPITLGLTPIWVATADLRGIGKTDLIVAEADSNSVGVFLGNGDGTFTESSIALPGSAATLAIGDFNHDGKLDIAVPMNDENSPDFMVMLPGKGDGTFGSPIATQGGSPSVFWVSSADLNGDGVPDLVLTESAVDYLAVQVYLSNGDGTFSAGQVIAQNYASMNVSTLLVDADEDGKLDALVADSFGLLWFYHGNGDGTFSTNPTDFQIGDVPFGMAEADVNGDGHLDVIASGIIVGDLLAYGVQAGDQICVLEGDGKGNFGSPKVYRGDSSSWSVAIADFNGDGHPDAVTANQYNDSATVFLNDGLGGFRVPQGNWVGYVGGGAVNAPMSGAITTDVDGDGSTDVVFMEWNQPPDNYYQLTVLLNDGHGHLSAPVRSDAINGNYGTFGDFILADFRNTGRPDFLAIAANYGSNGPFISFAPNEGGGHFGPLTVTNPQNVVGVIGVGDFNHDGKLDFIAAGLCGANANNFQCIQVFLGNGDGTFQTGFLQVFGGTGIRTPVAVYVGDFNRDGKLDLLVFLDNNGGWTLNDDVYEFFGKGDGTFQPGTLLFSHFGPMVVADVDGDGHPDIVNMLFPISVNETPQPVQFSIYLGQPDGSFKLSNTYAPYGYGGFLAQAPYGPGEYFAPMLGDFNGDGKLDIAAFQRVGTNNPDAFVQFLLGNGDGTFTPTYEIFDFRKPEVALFAADLMGTGRSDLFELDGYRSTYTVLQSITAPPFQFELIDDPIPGNKGSGIVLLDVASASSTTISLTASDPAISVPPTLTINAGQVSKTFNFTIGSGFNPTHVFSITATLGGTSAVAYGSMVPSGAGFQAQAGGPLSWPKVNLISGQTIDFLAVGASSTNGYTTTLNFACLGVDNQAQCQFNPPSVVLRSNDFSNSRWVLSVPAGTAEGSYPGKVRVTDGVLTQDIPFTLNVGDFKLDMSPATDPVFPNGVANFTITLTSVFNFDGSVSLACSGLPAGLSCPSPWFSNPAPSGAPVSLQLPIQNNSPGNYTLTVTGSSSPVTHSASATLQVWDIGGSLTPASATVTAGGSANFNVSLASVNGFTGRANLGCQPSTQLISCSFNPAMLSIPANGNATSVLTLTASSQLGPAADRRRARLMLLASIPLLLTGVLFLGAPNSWRKLAGALFLLSVLALMISCGGSSGSGGGGGTPYSIVIQVTSGNYIKDAGTITLAVK